LKVMDMGSTLAEPAGFATPRTPLGVFVQQHLHLLSLHGREYGVWRSRLGHRLINENHLVDSHLLTVHIDNDLVAFSRRAGHRGDPLSLLQSSEVADAILNALLHLGRPADYQEVSGVGQHEEARLELLVTAHQAHTQLNAGVR
jgi:hypothetical protein